VLAVALLILAVIFNLISNALLQRTMQCEGTGRKKEVTMTVKQKFYAIGSATASVISGLLTNVAAVAAVPG
jgi:hypothetical protein